jgi:hypothetical protein
VKVGGQRVEVAVSWRDEAHLSNRTEPPAVYLNAHTMARDLLAVFEDLSSKLPPGGPLPRLWVKKSVVNIIDDRHIPIWHNWLSATKENL